MNSYGTFVLADAPTKSIEIGIDCMSYDTGPNFKGISCIPPGLHFFYYSVGVGAREGLFFRVEKNEIFVKVWDDANEVVDASASLSEESLSLLRNQLICGQLNSNIGPYPSSQYPSWCNLSNFITEGCLQRTRCQIGTIVSGVCDESFVEHNTWNTNSSTGQPRYIDFMAVETKLNIVGCTASETLGIKVAQVTERNMDQSELLATAISKYLEGNWVELIAELQLSFVLFVLLYSHDGLKHWQLMISIICNSEHFLVFNVDFSSTFIRVLYQQLQYCPTDFFTVELSRDNFLRPSLARLFDVLKGVVVNSDRRTKSGTESLVEHATRLLRFVQKRFGLFVEQEVKSFAELNFEDYMLDADDSGPVVLDVKEGDDSAVPEFRELEPLVGKELSSLEILEAKWGWRYPLLFNEMRLSHLAEDMIMTALRVLECSDSDKSPLCIEAVMFIENESNQL